MSDTWLPAVSLVSAGGKTDFQSVDREEETLTCGGGKKNPDSTQDDVTPPMAVGSEQTCLLQTHIEDYLRVLNLSDRCG